MEIYENLKLPICPKCGDTEHVEEIKDIGVLLVVRVSYPWFGCRACEIYWNARDGIKEKGEHFDG